MGVFGAVALWGAAGLLLGVAVGLGIPFRHQIAVPAIVAAASPPDRVPRVVCTRRPRSAELVASADCDEMQTRLDWCNARVNAATRTRATTAPPEAIGIDDPADWDRRLRRLLAACGFAGSVRNTDCSEYPCVTAVRFDGDEAGFLNGDDECPARQGVTGAESLHIVPVTVACGDGRADTLWMVGIADEAVMTTLYPRASRGFLPAVEVVLLGARRAEALAAGWACPGESATGG